MAKAKQTETAGEPVEEVTLNEDGLPAGEPVEEVTLNEDGLPAGEPVDWATLQKVLAEKRHGNAETDDAA